MANSFTISQFIDEAVANFNAGEFVLIVGDENTDVTSIVSSVSTALTSDGKTNEVYAEGQNFVYYKTTRVDVTERRNPPNDFTPKDDIRDGPTPESAKINLAIVKHHLKPATFIALVTATRELSSSVYPQTSVQNSAVHAIFELPPNSVYKLYDKYYFIQNDTTVYEVHDRTQ
jgi:hypothetical protein